MEAPLASASAARAVIAVRSLHRFASAEGLTAEDPARSIRPSKPPRRLPKALSLEQVQAMLGVPATDTEVGVRDAALLELLYGTGIRISEAVALDVDDIERLVRIGAGERAPGLRVLGKGGKERIVPVGSYARAALDAYLVRGRPVLTPRSRGTPALFLNTRGGRLSRQSAWAILRSVAEKAGITADVSPHTLRHSYATICWMVERMSASSKSCWAMLGDDNPDLHTCNHRPLTGSLPHFSPSRVLVSCRQVACCSAHTALAAAERNPRGAEPPGKEEAGVQELHEGEASPNLAGTDVVASSPTWWLT